MDNINIILQNCKSNRNTRGELHNLQHKDEVTLRQARVLTKTKTIKTKDSNPIVGATWPRLLPTAKVCTSREDHVKTKAYHGRYDEPFFLVLHNCQLWRRVTCKTKTRI